MKPVYILKKQPYLSAIDKLIEHYKTNPKNRVHDCPFCKTADNHCSLCPWTWFTKKDCVEYFYAPWAGWIRRRLKELPEWRRRIEKM